MSGPAHVFTYGSLMFDPVWSRVVSARYRSVPAVLRDFRRHAIAGETYPATVAAPGGEIRGRLWLSVQPPDLARLDRFEGAEYRRETVEVDVDREVDPSGRLSAGCYIWLDASRLLPQDWDAEVFERDHLAGFAQRHGAGGSASAG